MNKISKELQIEKEENKIKKYSIAMTTAIYFLEINPREKKAIENLIGHLKNNNDKTEKRASRIPTLRRKLNDVIDNKPRFINYSEIEKKIDIKNKDYKYIPYEEIHSIVENIKENPSEALIKFAEEYINSIKKIDSINNKEIKKQQKKLKKEQTTKVEKEPIKENKQPVSIENLLKEEEKNQTPKKSCDEQKINKTIEYIDRKYSAKVNGSSPTLRVISLEKEDRKLLEEILEDSYYNYIVPIENYIEKGYTIKGIMNTFEIYQKEANNPFKKPNIYPKIEELLTLGIEVINLLPIELQTIYNKDDEKNNILKKISLNANIPNILTSYNKAFEIYTNYYNKLKEPEKIEIESNFNSEKYSKILDIDYFEIVNPDKIKKIINNKISIDMISKRHEYTKEQSEQIIENITKSSSLMSNEEITNIYFSTLREYEKSESTYKRITKKQIKEKIETMQNLQYNYAMSMTHRIPKEEKDKLSIDEQLKYIVEKYFHENTLFNLDKGTELVLNNKSESNKIITVSKYDAQNKYYGMSKVKLTASTINNKWSSFQELENFDN